MCVRKIIVIYGNIQTCCYYFLQDTNSAICLYEIKNHAKRKALGYNVIWHGKHVTDYAVPW